MMKRLTGIMIAVVCCALVLSFASAEVTADTTEANGRVTQIEWKDEEGNLAPGPEGYARVRYAYKGNDTTETYFNEEGVVCQSNEGSYGKKTTVDGKGRVTSVEYLDTDGKRMLNRMGYGMLTISYYGFGEVRLVSYYGMGKRQVIVPALGYAKVFNEYSYKTMTLREFQDVNGKPVDLTGKAVLTDKLLRGCSEAVITATMG